MSLFLPASRGHIRSNGNYWSSTENDSNCAYYLYVTSENVGVYYNCYRSSESSARCLKN